jgi:hypothetical protein
MIIGLKFSFLLNVPKASADIELLGPFYFFIGKGRSSI